MATPSNPAAAQPPPAAHIPTTGILSGMLRVSKQVSDLIFSPGRAPQSHAFCALASPDVALGYSGTRSHRGDARHAEARAVARLGPSRAGDGDRSLAPPPRRSRLAFG